MIVTWGPARPPALSPILFERSREVAGLGDGNRVRRHLEVGGSGSVVEVRLLGFRPSGKVLRGKTPR